MEGQGYLSSAPLSSHFMVGSESITNLGGTRYINHVATCFCLASPLDTHTQKGALWSWPNLRILAMAIMFGMSICMSGHGFQQVK